MSIKKKFKHYFNKSIEWARPYLTLKMLPFLLIAWMLTNGWAYVFVAIGTPTMRIIGGAWISFLWFPFTVEKVATVFIAGLLYKVVYKKEFKEVRK